MTQNWTEVIKLAIADTPQFKSVRSPNETDVANLAALAKYNYDTSGESAAINVIEYTLNMMANPPAAPLSERV